MHWQNSNDVTRAGQSTTSLPLQASPPQAPESLASVYLSRHVLQSTNNTNTFLIKWYHVVYTALYSAFYISEIRCRALFHIFIERLSHAIL